jgi:hypothetical protein
VYVRKQTGEPSGYKHLLARISIFDLRRLGEDEDQVVVQMTDARRYQNNITQDSQITNEAGLLESTKTPAN